MGARQNHAGEVPANCGSGEQVGRRPRHRAAWRRKNAASHLNLESGEVELPGDADFAAFVERAV